MADEQTEQKTEEKTEKKPAAGSSNKMAWIIAAAVALVSAGGGYGISVLSADTSLNMFRPSAPAQASTKDPQLAIDNPTPLSPISMSPARFATYGWRCIWRWTERHSSSSARR
jgi:hypothetical protein